MAKKLILFGIGKVTAVINYYLKRDTDWDICAFCVDKEYLKSNNETFNDKPVVAFEDIEKLYPPEEHSMAIAIGYHKMNKVREARYNTAKEKGYNLINYIS